MGVVSIPHERLDSWIYRNRERLKSGMRILFGVVWGIDGVLKFRPGVVSNFPSSVQNAGNGQPAWLQAWFSFWATQASQNATFWVYLTGALEIALAAALLLGFARKLAYGGGILLSLFIWAVPEGFGGPYGPSSTDIGTGVVYAFVFLLLMIVNATYGPSRYSLDRLLERRWPGWSRIAEIRGPWVRDDLSRPRG
jgi:uncharacterized membrane protein YphA (DoxX/SURF4 family)